MLDNTNKNQGNQSGNNQGSQGTQGGQQSGGNQDGQQTGGIDPFDRGLVRDYERCGDDTPYEKKSS